MEADRRIDPAELTNFQQDRLAKMGHVAVQKTELERKMQAYSKLGFIYTDSWGNKLHVTENMRKGLDKSLYSLHEDLAKTDEIGEQLAQNVVLWSRNESQNKE